MRRKLVLLALALIVMTSAAAPAFAAGSGDIPIGLKLYGFEAAGFAENSEGEYVGTLELTAYHIGYQWNIKQVSIANDGGLDWAPDYANNIGIAVGRFKYVTPEWQYFTMHTFSQEEAENIVFPVGFSNE